jgi:hypothetical protein
MIAGLALLNIGLASRYGSSPFPFFLGLAFLAVRRHLLVDGRNHAARVHGAQLPLPDALLLHAGGRVPGSCCRAGAASFIDLALASFLAMTSLHYLSKPFAAVLLGGPGRNAAGLYLATAYAMFSQSMGTVFVLATALILMALLVSDLLREVTKRSVTDPLSGLLNRRGFEEKLAELVAAHEFRRPAHSRSSSLRSRPLQGDQRHIRPRRRRSR